MAPKLYGHPFASYCQKAFMAFYEKDVAFDLRLLAAEEPANLAEHRALWPIGKFPVLEADGRVVVEATAIIEWLEIARPGRPRLIPEEPCAALDVRMRDRIFDHYVMEPMQRIVADRLRPEGAGDRHGVEDAKRALDVAYDWLDRDLGSREWAAGEAISMADCAAAPALFYADWVRPFDGRENLIAYYARLRARPSFARCVEDARPMRALFPGGAPKDRIG